MFSSSFTMSEQKHRQWTPYKHGAPALRDRLRLYLRHVLPLTPLAHLEICARPSCSRCRGRAKKNWRGNESKEQHALPGGFRGVRGGSNARPRVAKTDPEFNHRPPEVNLMHYRNGKV